MTSSLFQKNPYQKLLRSFFDQKLSFFYHLWPKNEFFLPFFFIKWGREVLPNPINPYQKKNWGGQKRGMGGGSHFLTKCKQKTVVFMPPLRGKYGLNSPRWNILMNAFSERPHCTGRFGISKPTGNFISTKRGLRRPMTYDNRPVPSHNPTYGLDPIQSNPIWTKMH